MNLPMLLSEIVLALLLIFFRSYGAYSNVFPLDSFDSILLMILGNIGKGSDDTFILKF